MRDITNIQHAIIKERLSIPGCNVAKFNAEADSYLKEMEIADDTRFVLLCAKLWERTCWLRKMNALCVPPLLCQKLNEPKEDYLNRIYTAGRYHAG